MIVLLFIACLAVIIAINIFLWKSGFLFDAERPKLVIDRPVKDPKERKAAQKRIRRWRDEGRISAEEYERWTQLCEEQWDATNQ